MVDSTVACNACGHTIRFPSPFPSTRVLRQMAPTPVEIPRNILCPYCKYVLLYEAPESHLSGVENTDPNLAQEDWVHVCIAVKCAQEHCDSRVRIHSIMLESNNMRKEASEILSESICVKAVCDKGEWQTRLNRADCEVYAVQG